jgi:hypothetical protein
MNLARLVAAPAVAIAITAAIAGSASAAPKPSAAELQGTLRAALTGDSSAYEPGGVGPATSGRVQAVVAAAGPAYRYTVQNPITVNGDVASATVVSAVPPYDAASSYSFPLSWKLVGGKWKLTTAAQCTIAKSAFVLQSC